MLETIVLTSQIQDKILYLFIMKAITAWIFECEINKSTEAISIVGARGLNKRKMERIKGGRGCPHLWKQKSLLGHLSSTASWIIPGQRPGVASAQVMYHKGSKLHFIQQPFRKQFFSFFYSIFCFIWKFTLLGTIRIAT